MTLELPAPVREAMVAHAREGAPEEVVGVLAGVRGPDRSTVERRYPATNAAETPATRYEIAPREELRVLERVGDAGLDVVGFYHSHPRGPSEPSPTDARLAAWPGYSYVVVSLRSTAGGAEPTVGSWRWTGGVFERERLAIR